MPGLGPLYPITPCSKVQYSVAEVRLLEYQSIRFFFSSCMILVKVIGQLAYFFFLWPDFHTLKWYFSQRNLQVVKIRWVHIRGLKPRLAYRNGSVGVALIIQTPKELEMSLVPCSLGEGVTWHTRSVLLQLDHIGSLNIPCTCPMCTAQWLLLAVLWEPNVLGLKQELAALKAEPCPLQCLSKTSTISLVHKALLSLTHSQSSLPETVSPLSSSQHLLLCIGHISSQSSKPRTVSSK